MQRADPQPNGLIEHEGRVDLHSIRVILINQQKKMDADLHSLPARGNEYGERKGRVARQPRRKQKGSWIWIGAEPACKFGREGALERKVRLVGQCPLSLGRSAAVIAAGGPNGLGWPGGRGLRAACGSTR